MREWGLDPDEFKSDDFDIIDLIHPDDEITNPITEGVAFRVVERGTDSHCIDQGFKRMASCRCHHTLRYSKGGLKTVISLLQDPRNRVQLPSVKSFIQTTPITSPTQR